jgi:hypothetical protein
MLEQRSDPDAHKHLEQARKLWKSPTDFDALVRHTRQMLESAPT